jgi:pimeloyl-ACP methyl ester carboxylesterase
VGHSLGGFLTLAFAIRYPHIASRIVIVDAYPFTLGLVPETTPAQAKTIARQIRDGILKGGQPGYEEYVKSGRGMRSMVTVDSDFQRLVAWSLASDRTAVGDALYEMFSQDLREEVSKIEIPALVLGAWRGNEQYTDLEGVRANLRSQYAKLRGVDIRVNQTARHFIMWDDPQWMLSHLDRFLRAR